jgi:hypothetical protein
MLQTIRHPLIYSGLLLKSACLLQQMRLQMSDTSKEFRYGPWLYRNPVIYDI